MINSSINDNKKLIEKIVDFTNEIVKINRAEVRIDNFIRIEKDNEMSIDAIALGAYGTTDAFDVLCKWNGITNPLSIKDGDIIEIPNLNSLFANMSKLNVQNMKLAKNEENTLRTTIKNTGSKSPSKKSSKGRSVGVSKDGNIVF